MEVSNRLYKTPKSLPKIIKNEIDDHMNNATVISTLPANTLKWIKSRRTFDTKRKAIISHYRENQLREIFHGLDIGYFILNFII